MGGEEGFVRVYEEPIDVRLGMVSEGEVPVQFVWRGELWSVRVIEDRWVVSEPWWDAPAARAVRDGTVEAPGDVWVMVEEEVWRVVAARGRAGTSGVYELTRALATGVWRLSRVLD